MARPRKRYSWRWFVPPGGQHSRLSPLQLLLLVFGLRCTSKRSLHPRRRSRCSCQQSNGRIVAYEAAAGVLGRGVLAGRARYRLGVGLGLCARLRSRFTQSKAHSMFESVHGQGGSDGRERLQGYRADRDQHGIVGRRRPRRGGTRGPDVTGPAVGFQRGALQECQRNGVGSLYLSPAERSDYVQSRTYRRPSTE